MGTKVAVVGAGVIGLTTALTLAQQGIHTTILTSLRPESTTSSQAGALWHPFLVEQSQLVYRWSLASYNEYMRLNQIGEGGIVIRELCEYFDEQKDDIWCLDGIAGARRLPPEELPARFRDGISLEVPLIEPRLFLRYLENKFIGFGGKLKIEKVITLEQNLDNYDYIVNCCGLSARELCGDREVYPISGQTVCVSRHEKITSCRIDDTKADQGYPTYVFVRSQDILLGGFARKTVEFEGTSQLDTDDILRRTELLQSELSNCKFISAQGGSRPGRKTVRLELDPLTDRIIHNYGHSGSGYTLCWGCASDVLDLIVRRL